MAKISRVRASETVKSRPGPTLRLRLAGALAVALAGSALALAGCGGTSSNTTSASSATGTGTGGAPASSQTASANEAAQFSQCMRAHGVPDFPDPNANGSFDLKVTKGSDLDPNSSAFKSADQACKSLQPAGFGRGSESVANQNKTLQFVSCMRKNGVPNFPDPGSNGAFLIQGSSGVDPNSPQFKSAMQACHKLLPGGGTGAPASQGG